MNANTRLLAGVLFASACLGLTPALRAADGGGDGTPTQNVLQYRGHVVVGDDGNGVTAASFPTTVGGELVHYWMVIENGCRPGTPDPCPPPVDGISITLNGAVVFQTNDVFHLERVEVALNRVGGDPNGIVIAATGVRGAAARVAILAHRPIDAPFGGRSVLPWAAGSDTDRTIMTVHNAGPADIAFRLVLYAPDGTFAGRTAPRILPAHATVNVDLPTAAAGLGLNWRRGAVHVQWASRNFSRISTVARSEHREPDAAGIMRITSIRALALDDYGPHPLNPEQLRDVFVE